MYGSSIPGGRVYALQFQIVVGVKPTELFTAAMAQPLLAQFPSCVRDSVPLPTVNIRVGDRKYSCTVSAYAAPYNMLLLTCWEDDRHLYWLLRENEWGEWDACRIMLELAIDSELRQKMDSCAVDEGVWSSGRALMFVGVAVLNDLFLTEPVDEAVL